MSGQPRHRMVVGNWKMYKTHTDAEQYLTEVIPLLKGATIGIGIAVPYTLIQMAAQMATGTNIAIGAQNMNDATEGAFTGEIAARMLTEAGASFVILGHSERRRLFAETDALINRKIKKALASDLRPLFCIGETLQEHQEGKTQEVLKRQLTEGLADLSADALGRLWIAYEPVWAIGTGETASPEQAQNAHAFIRAELSSLVEGAAAHQITLLYGGSVQPANAAALTQQPDIDGLLVGGASLSPEIFSQIVNVIHTLPVGNET